MLAKGKPSSLVGDINERLYFWDLKIQDALQNFPKAVHRGYVVGQSLAALRWYYPSVRFALDQDGLHQICGEYIPLLGRPCRPSRRAPSRIALWFGARQPSQIR